MALKITVLGSGTSSGVPTIGCSCAVCKSSDPRDRRLRPSILLQHGSTNIVIDTTPDFRQQVLAAGIDHLDAIVYTHAHADHIFGMDDIRPFNYRQQSNIPIYAAPDTLAVIRRVFDYVFDTGKRSTNIPKIEVNLIGDAPFEAGGLSFVPIPVMHGQSTVLGFRFGNAAYLTDHSAIPDSSMEKLQGLDVLFLDALRYKPHPTHSTLEASIATAQTLQSRRTFFTHMCHDIPHAATAASLPPGIFLAYDGLEIEVASHA